VVLLLTYTSAEHLGKLNKSTESLCPQKYRLEKGEIGGQKIALVYVAGEKKAYIEGPAAQDVVTAYRKLWEGVSRMESLPNSNVKL